MIIKMKEHFGLKVGDIYLDELRTMLRSMTKMVMKLYCLF